jgi:replicative DNA helicase
MRLSAPIYLLKLKARRLSRDENVPLHAALDRVARMEGYRQWSLLAAKAAVETPASKLFSKLLPSDVLLVGSRPGQGKTRMSFELVAQAAAAGKESHVFTLEYSQRQARDLFLSIGIAPVRLQEQVSIDCSDRICADYIIERLAGAQAGSVAVIDYLQLLDQRRENPDLGTQVRALKSFARERGIIFVFVSQINRAFDAATKSCPDLGDVRLPNPLDLGLFSKACFLNEGRVVFRAP